MAFHHWKDNHFSIVGVFSDLKQQLLTLLDAMYFLQQKEINKRKNFDEWVKMRSSWTCMDIWALKKILSDKDSKTISKWAPQLLNSNKYALK